MRLALGNLIDIIYLLIKFALPFFFVLDNTIVYLAFKKNILQNNSYIAFHRKYGKYKIVITKIIVFAFLLYFLIFDPPLNIYDMGYILVFYYIFVGRLWVSYKRCSDEK
jgi:hypothetical protein